MQTFLEGIKLAKEKYIEQMPFNQKDSKNSKEFLDTNGKNIEICNKNFVSLQKKLNNATIIIYSLPDRTYYVA